MNITFLLNSGKNPKWKYYLRCYGRRLVPDAFYRNRLYRVLQQARLRNDFEYIQQRVDYYCRLDSYVDSPNDTFDRIDDIRMCRQKVYYFDSMEYLRWFEPHLKVSLLPGDIDYIPKKPQILKSRPVGDGNENGVLLNMDKVRHFIFINDKKNFEEKRDIVHFHGKVYPTSKPYVVTQHGNLKPSGKADVNTIFVSRNHAERHNSESYVYNGLDWDDYGDVPLGNIRLHYHFLGNAAWRVKNVKGAIDVIKLLPEERLWVMGGHRFNFKMGMRFTFNRQVSFMPKAYGEYKLRLLKESKGFIFPVTWHEPFGLAIIESLYCGAPVFGTPYGSLPEIVVPEVGYLTSNSLEMARRIDDRNRFNPMICHEYASDMFNSKKMAEGYLKKYETVLDGKTLNPHEPIIEHPDRRLFWRNVKRAPLYIPGEEKD